MAQKIFNISAIGNNSYNGTESGHDLNTAIGAPVDSTSYGSFGARTGRSTTSYVNFIFDASELPDDVVINSVSIRIKASVSNISYLTTRTVRPWVLDDWAATAQTVSAVGSIYAFDVSSYVNTKADLFQNGNPDIGFQFSVTRGSSNTSTAAYARIYGAELIIDYTPNVTYHLTIEDNGHDVDPSNITNVEYAGDTVIPITINEDPLPTVTLDGNDITDQFVQRGDATTWQGSPDDSNFQGLSSGSNYITNAEGHTAENPASSSNVWYSGSGAAVDTAYAEYYFNTSEIPSNAQDIVVSCKVAGRAESSSYTHQAGGKYSVWQLYSSDTPKGEQIYTTSTVVTTIEFTNTGSWSRSDLNSISVRHFVGYYGGSTNGITLTISYSLPGSGGSYRYNLVMDSDHTLVVGGSDAVSTLYIKKDNEWKRVSTIYLKLSGIWREISAESLNTEQLNNASNGTWSGYFIDT